MTHTRLHRLAPGASLTALLLAVACATPALAEHHATREYDHLRRERQMHQINHERRDGQLSASQAQAMRSDVRSNYNEERADIAANGGHLSRADQHILNQQLNASGHDIHQAEVNFDNGHPARARDNRQRMREVGQIDRDVRNGTLSPQQAHALRSDLHTDYEQERSDAALDHSHLTRADQRAIRQQQNEVGAQIPH